MNRSIVLSRPRREGVPWRRIAGALVMAGVVASGCAVGPNYRPPQTVVTPAFELEGRTDLAAGDPALTWWLAFNDPKLNELVSQALTNNHDLRIAKANLLEARALRRERQFDFLPTVNANAGYANELFSKAALPGVSQQNREREFYDAGFDATWEIDVFGHVRRSVEAATADVQAIEATQHDVQLSLISEVARNYFELRGFQNQLTVARRNADNQQETLKITQARLDGGRGTELDVARSRAQWNTTLAILPPLEGFISQAIHRLAVLTGHQPSSTFADLNVPAQLPNLPPVVNLGSPEALLRRRPDVRAAERQLAASTARIGVATADLFPRVTFNGRVALEAETFSGFGESGSGAWSFGPRITWAALDLGHVRARIKAADARAQAALASYERTVLISLEETDNALVDFGRQQARREYLREAVQASQTATRLARQRYENGATDFLTVLDAQRALLEAEDQLAFSGTRTATAIVAVYKSLGGGWETVTNGIAGASPVPK